MAILNTEDFKKVLHKISSYSTDDDNIKIIEDLTDTFTAIDKVGEYEDKVKELEEKLSETEKSWREKYTARFYEGEEKEKTAQQFERDKPPEPDKAETITLDDIFTEISA